MTVRKGVWLQEDIPQKNTLGYQKKNLKLTFHARSGKLLKYLDPLLNGRVCGEQIIPRKTMS